MSCFVLDCSVTMAWCFDDEADPRAQSALAALDTQEAIVPSHWPLEVANVLVGAERRQRITEANVARFLEIVGRLHITIDDQTARKACGDILALARTHGLTAYDAAYLELALRTGCSLVSLDAAMNRAATTLGIALWSQ